MGKAMRKIGVPLAAYVLAILTVAMSQLVFEIVFPALSDQLMLQTGISTWFAFFLFAVLFFAVGYVAPKWLDARWPLAWLLWPLVALYAVALIQQPEQYTYFQLQSPVFYLIHGPFIISGSALVAGYLAKSHFFEWARHAT